MAKKNNLKVGDKVTVGNPTKASETYKFTVRGIYEYTPPARRRPDTVPTRNTRKTTARTWCTRRTSTCAKYRMWPEVPKGWAILNLNIIFTLTDPATYNKFVRLVTKAKLDMSKFTDHRRRLMRTGSASHRWTPPPRPRARRCWRP